MATLDEHARAGLKAIEERRFDDAIAAFRSAVDLAPERPDLNNLLAMAFLHRGDAGNAIPPLERAVQLSEPYEAPEHQALRREFHLSLATAYQLMDRVTDAAALLRRVIDRWPSQSVEARLQLGQLLLSTGDLPGGMRAYEDAADWLDKDQRSSAEALVGTLRAFLETEHDGRVFLQAHAESYAQYFDEVAAAQEKEGWYAEAARMSRGADGELHPVLPDGARPYAMSRVDLVNPADGTVSSVYSEAEPMVVALNGLEALAQVPVLLPWKAWPFEVLVSTRCPWHWLSVTVQLDEAPGSAEALTDLIDPVIGGWYLSGFNGEFGEKERGRFHYVTDPDPLGDRALSYVVDLGRASFEAVPALLRRLAVLHDRARIRRVVLGEGRLTDAA